MDRDTHTVKITGAKRDTYWYADLVSDTFEGTDYEVVD